MQTTSDELFNLTSGAAALVVLFSGGIETLPLPVELAQALRADEGDDDL